MASFTVQAQTRSGPNFALSTGDHVWLSGVGGTFGTNMVVNAFPDGVHISDVNDQHRTECSAGGHVHNIKYVDPTHFSLDGGSSTVLGTGVPAITTAPLHLQFTVDGSTSVSTTGAKFYAFDGVTDANPWGGINFQAIEVGVSTSWSAANGVSSALSLQDQSAAPVHDFYIGFSASPTSTGEKTGAIKLTLAYV